MPKLPKAARPFWNPPKESRPPQSGRRFHNPDYHTRRWRSLRESVIRDRPLCAICERAGVVTAAKVVDHILPVSKGETEFERKRRMWDRSNLQPLCESCHNRKSQSERQ